uniref:Uncharacterized protein n=1 Tax=Moniliophthora roreri TaxID=221103 RepID=A0A0W0FWC0_MONRR
MVGLSVLTPLPAASELAVDIIAYLVENASRLVKRGTYLIDVIHEDKLDPNFALLLSRNDEELKAKGAGLVSELLSGPFYDPKIAADSGLLGIYNGEAADAAKEGFFKQLPRPITIRLLRFGFIGGEEPREDDFHLGAWIARIVLTLGVQTSEEAAQAVEKSYGKPLPEKVAYWRAWVSKPSWKKVYAEGLH